MARANEVLEEELREKLAQRAEELAVEQQLEQDLAMLQNTQAYAEAISAGADTTGGTGMNWLQELQALREPTTAKSAVAAMASPPRLSELNCPSMPPSLGRSLVDDMQEALRLEEELGMRLPAVNLNRASPRVSLRVSPSPHVEMDRRSPTAMASTRPTSTQRLLFPLREARAGTSTAQHRTSAY